LYSARKYYIDASNNLISKKKIWVQSIIQKSKEIINI
jgi:hypothetical protein